VIKNLKKPELLAPAGDWEMLTTAVNSGCNAVYFGVEKLNMRAKAKNFTLDELPGMVEFCKEKNVDTHLTLNSIVYENELNDAEEIIVQAKRAGVTLIICWDLSAIQLCKKHEMPFCISTQASISNSSSAEFYKNLGAARIVLARECTLDQIKEIKSKVDIEIETFVHGAMCVAVSGRCFMSHSAFGQSANRGECIQPCRRKYKIYDTDGEYSFEIGEDYVMSPKDLNTIEFIDEIIEAGIDSLKVEGRKRSPEYIAKVISTYRKAIDLYFEGKLTDEIKKEMFTDLGKVYNRGFSAGFYFGVPEQKDYTEGYGNRSTTRKKHIGKVINYFKKSKIVHIKIEADSLSTGEEIYFIGETTGVAELTIESMQKDSSQIESATKGDEITFKCESTVRPRDKVYKIIDIKR